jgi:hypothetical protein
MAWLLIMHRDFYFLHIRNGQCLSSFEQTLHAIVRMCGEKLGWDRQLGN